MISERLSMPNGTIGPTGNRKRINIMMNAEGQKDISMMDTEAQEAVNSMSIKDPRAERAGSWLQDRADPSVVERPRTTAVTDPDLKEPLMAIIIEEIKWFLKKACAGIAMTAVGIFFAWEMFH